MRLAELQNPSVLELLPVVDGIDPSTSKQRSNFLQVGDWIALPVTQVACRIDGQTDPEILDESGVSLGTLCLTARLSGLTPEAMTAWQYVAYLADIEAAQAGGSHTFRSNYAVISSDFFDDYVKQYYNSAPIWGGFSHAPAATATSRVHNTIVARPDIVLPTKYHSMAFSRYTSANNAFERFLRLYHSIELIFDFIVMKKIQALNDDMDGFGEIVRANGRTEIERLRYIFREYCDDWESLAAKFAPVAAFEPRAKILFQDHTKDGNPLQASDWSTIIANCAAGQMTEADFLRSKLCNAKKKPYDTFVSNLAAYWIYRVRSSIAHSRVSEFLFDDTDEDFIVDFAEGILLEAAVQVFSSSKLKKLL